MLNCILARELAGRESQEDSISKYLFHNFDLCCRRTVCSPPLPWAKLTFPINPDKRTCIQESLKPWNLQNDVTGFWIINIDFKCVIYPHEGLYPPQESSSLIFWRVKALFRFHFCTIRLSFSFPLVTKNQRGIIKPTLGKRHLTEEP